MRNIFSCHLWGKYRKHGKEAQETINDQNIIWHPIGYMQFACQIISAKVQMCQKVNQERQNRGSWAAWGPIWILYAVHYVFKTNCGCGQKIIISKQNHLTGYNYKIDYRTVRQNFLFLCVFSGQVTTFHLIHNRWVTNTLLWQGKYSCMLWKEWGEMQLTDDWQLDFRSVGTFLYSQK
jgi:hypothetical protein